MISFSEFSYAPFGATNDWYHKLWTYTNFWMEYYNYQVYAGGLSSVQDYTAKLASIEQTSILNGSTDYNHVGMGICSSTTSPRGLQLPDILTAWKAVHALGSSSVVIWCLEDSAENNYAIERAIQANS